MSLSRDCTSRALRMAYYRFVFAHQPLTILHFISVHFITMCWWLFILVWAVSAFFVKPIAERQSWDGKLVVFAFLTLTFMLLGKIPWRGLNAPILPGGSIFRRPACILTFMGLTVSVWSRVYLGANWSGSASYREGHELIQHGPYRFVRHPMYTGFLLMVGGTAVGFRNASGLAALVVCFLGTWWKLCEEEALLSKHFPEAYERYRSNTKILILFIF